MISPTQGRLTYAEISASALRCNLAAVRRCVDASARLLTIVKADGYGHGAKLVGPIFEAAGADAFGVATLDEALELRDAGIKRPILILAGSRGADVSTLLEYDLATAVLHAEMVRDLNAALPAGRSLRVHLKVDTGMGRIGVLPDELGPLLEQLRGTGLQLEGLFSHFGNSDRVDREISDHQVERFRAALAMTKSAGFSPRDVHLANSAASVARRDTHFTLARPGIVLYGAGPSATAVPDEIRPAMRLVTHVLQIKQVAVGVPISYGQTFVAQRPSRIGVLSIGYADGYGRQLSNRGSVLVRGKRAPIAGTVCMDLTMVDLTDIPEAQLGDEVVLWGQQGDAHIDVNEVAAWQDTVGYEFLTRLGKRVPRILVE